MFWGILLAAIIILGASSSRCRPDSTLPADTDLKLLPGFHATVIAELGRSTPRHIVVTKEGDVYVKLDRLQNGKGILFLREKGDGTYQTISSFGDYRGTGIALKNGYLYASSDVAIYRYKLNDKDEVVDPEHPETIVQGLLDRHEHTSKSIILDDAGNLYTDIGAYSNDCQVQDRVAGSPGRRPCPILDSAGGIWQFKADQSNQTYGNGTRYATGLRNVVGLDWNTATNTLWVMQHGRDQFFENYPNLYSQEQGNELPAECLYELHNGSNCGWPYIYWDQFQHKKILNPEYGGDGKMTAEPDAQDPVVAFPGHLAPNGLLFYTGKQFPDKYRNGAFIVFHGSWNRQPEEKGYDVQFVPFSGNKPTADPVVFADNFAGENPIPTPNSAKHRPCGIAQGPDGSLFVTDDQGGTIYKITYTGK